MCACGSDKRAGWRQCCESLNLRQLYEVYVNNGQEYEDESHFTTIVVAKDREDAREKAKQHRDFKWHDTDDTWFHIQELNIIEGYRVKLEKI